jgi:hypothetical protein
VLTCPLFEALQRILPPLHQAITGGGGGGAGAGEAWTANSRETPFSKQEKTKKTKALTAKQAPCMHLCAFEPEFSEGCVFLFEMQMARIGLASVYASTLATRCRGTVAQLMTASALQQLQQGHRASGSTTCNSCNGGIEYHLQQLQQGHRASGSTTWCLIRGGRGGWGCR